MYRDSLEQIGLSVALLIALATETGCTATRPVLSGHATAPTLREDAPLSSRGGTNPNAPYTLVDHSARLVQRPMLTDVSAAIPCAAANLSLFESGAYMDGERRSVRLNLVNRAKEPCRLNGYPAVSLLGPEGGLIGSLTVEKVTASTLETVLKSQKSVMASDVAATETPSPYVLLPPSGEASFEVGWTSGPACDLVGSIAVAAPGTVQTLLIKHELRVCQGRILITAISDTTEL